MKFVLVTLLAILIQSASLLPAPTKGKGWVPSITATSEVQISNLCAPGSTTEAEKKSENVGAFGVFLSQGLTEDINDNLKAYTKFGSYVNYLEFPHKVYFFLAGTETGDASLPATKVLPGNSTLNYVCFNSFNLTTDVIVINIIGPKPTNKLLYFSVVFNDWTTAINEVTCDVARALFGNDAAQKEQLTNTFRHPCNAPSMFSFGQGWRGERNGYFLIKFNSSTADSSILPLTEKLNDVATAISQFASVRKLGFSSPITVSIPHLGIAKSVNPSKIEDIPIPFVNSVGYSASSIELNITVNIPATVHLVCVPEKTQGEDSLFTSGSGVLEKTSIELSANQVVSYKLTKNIKESTNYLVYYKAQSKANSTIQSKILYIFTSTDKKTDSGSGSCSISINSYFLLFLFLYFCFL